MIICKVCNIEKEESYFNRLGVFNEKIYYRKKCKQCQAAMDKIRNQKYLKKPEVKERIKKYRTVNRETQREKNLKTYYKKYRKLKVFIKVCEKCGCNIERALYNSRWCKSCRHISKIEYCREYSANNKERCRRINAKSHRKQMQTNPLYVLRRRCRTRLNDVLVRKRGNTPSYLGCSIEKLKQYLETHFKAGMSWNNMEQWHIDHIIPLCTAVDEEDTYRLCYYKNLQPLWKHDNLSKASRDKKSTTYNIFKVRD